MTFFRKTAYDNNTIIKVLKRWDHYQLQGSGVKKINVLKGYKGYATNNRNLPSMAQYSATVYAHGIGSFQNIVPTHLPRMRLYTCHPQNNSTRGNVLWSLQCVFYYNSTSIPYIMLPTSKVNTDPFCTKDVQLMDISFSEDEPIQTFMPPLWSLSILSIVLCYLLSCVLYDVCTAGQ